MSERTPTFIVDCPYCKAKVVANESGRAVSSVEDKTSIWSAQTVIVGNCIGCGEILVGEYVQYFDGLGPDLILQLDVVRVFPKPPRTFSSKNIPQVASYSLKEADRCLQAGAYLAACVMFARALEAVCAHKLLTKEDRAAGKQKTLAVGVKELFNKQIIDARLFDWSEHLRAFRNLAAHASDKQISRNEVEDLQAFVYAIIEYIYDLTERYEEFKNRKVKPPIYDMDDEIPF